ncbi:hypothetical protein V8C34DRAFT_283970 [Trichoderma compactum]
MHGVSHIQLLFSVPTGGRAEMPQQCIGHFRPLGADKPMPGATIRPASSKTWETGEAAICASPCVAGVATNESTPGCGSSMGTSSTNDAKAAIRLANED